MALSPGTRLGPYEITAQIGVGGMGEVNRATDTTLNRQEAIKVLPESLASDAERIARFEREAKTLASLNHTNIAQIYGFEKSSGVHALVMELVGGRRSPTASPRVRSPLTRRSPSPSRSPRRWKPPTSRGSSTAISNPPT